MYIYIYIYVFSACQPEPQIANRRFHAFPPKRTHPRSVRDGLGLRGGGGLAGAGGGPGGGEEPAGGARFLRAGGGEVGWLGPFLDRLE